MKGLVALLAQQFFGIPIEEPPRLGVGKDDDAVRIDFDHAISQRIGNLVDTTFIVMQCGFTLHRCFGEFLQGARQLADFVLAVVAGIRQMGSQPRGNGVFHGKLPQGQTEGDNAAGMP